MSKSSSSGKKVVIVGGGIAGLTAGIYARKSGFDALVVESHSIPGGNCTSWRRKGYLFEGGMHWLNGSSPESRIRRLWEETGAINGDTQVSYRDPFLTCENGGRKVCCYRDVERFESHLSEVSPRDVPVIKEMCAWIRRFIKIKIPITNVRGLKLREKGVSIFKGAAGMLPALISMPFLNRTSVRDYISRFKNEQIRLLLSHVVNPDFDLVSFFFILSCFMSHDGGYVEGGSLKMTNNMAKYLNELGGELRCGLKADRVDIQNGKARGIIAGGDLIPADAVIATPDIIGAGGGLFDPPLRAPWLTWIKTNASLVVNTFFSMGIEAEIPEIDEMTVFPVEPFEYAGVTVGELVVNNYSGVPGYAPEGCSALTIRIRTDSYDYWKQAKEDGSYGQKKDELFKTVLSRMEEQYPRMKGKTAVWDVATPMTYERYVGTYHGSWMTKVLPGQSRTVYPVKPKGIEGLYLAGHRMQPPGGMPAALFSGRRAAQYLCKDFGVVFG
jgi:phytoene dehydrogenase-like protein